MSQRPKQDQSSPQVERTGTLIETDDDVREARRLALEKSLRPEPPAPVPAAPPTPKPASFPAPSPDRVSKIYRPTVRPPIALLTVFDDGCTDGEVIRIRDAKFVIGRVEGDLRIPFDGRISSRHVEITLQAVGGQHRWVVTDLQSTHGLFVRVSRSALADKAEFLVGNGRYRLDAPQPPSQPTSDLEPYDGASGATRGWDDSPSASFRPSALTELIGNEIGNRILLIKPDYWIGSDPACPICRPDDPFCEPRHVRVFRIAGKGWYAEHNKTQNGLWLRISQVVVETHAQFQIGEQRFLLKIG